MKTTTTTTKGLKKTTATTRPVVPSLEQVLDTMAFHIGELMTHAPGETVSDRTSIDFTAGIGGWEGTGCPLVIVTITMHRDASADPWGKWVRCELPDGTVLGNRCAARKHLAAAYAPVIAWVAAHHARAAAAEPVAVAS